MKNTKLEDCDPSRKPKNIKQHNQKLVLSLLQATSIVSISELSERTNLSKTTISKIITDFCDRGLVNSVGKGNSTSDGGKRPELFTLNPTFGYTIVLSLIKPGSILCAVVNLNYKTQYINTWEVDIASSYESIINQIVNAVLCALKSTRIDPAQLFGIAIACNGIINTDTGVLLYPTLGSLGTNLHIKDDLKRLLPFDVDLYIDTSHRFAAYAELFFEKNRKSTTLIIISTKYFLVGASILTNQKLVEGHNHIVGDFGHIILDPSSSIPCICGRKGCLTSLVSDEAIFKQIAQKCAEYPSSAMTKKYLENSLSVREVFAYANNGDKFAQAIVDYLVNFFSILLHNLISITNAKRIVLQGFYAAEGNYFLDNLRSEVLNFNDFDLRSCVEVDYSMLDLSPEFADIEAFILGAGFFVSSRYFDTMVF